jgi:hypothetical protein
MKLVYASHTETVVGDKKSITPEKLDKMLLAIAKRMYDDGDITLKEKVEDKITSTEALVRYYKIQD